MKIVIFAVALTFGGAALAQTGNTVDDPSQAMGPRGVTQQGTDPEGQACTPAGYNAGATAYPPCPSGNGARITIGPDFNYYTKPRPCSKTVTDSCVQTYERGRRR